jgi:hypothetical protein
MENHKMKSEKLRNFLRDYELGLLTNQEIVDGYQMLIENGLHNVLGDHYEHQAKRLISEGLCDAG